MDHLLEQIEEAVDQGLYFLALFATLSIPDICGALSSKGGKATPEKYRTWFDKNITPKYTQRIGPDLASFSPEAVAALPQYVRRMSGKPCTFFNGDDCYHFRCAVLHQARADHPNSRFGRIMFVVPSTGGPETCDLRDDSVLINVGTFCRYVVETARQWLADQQGTEPFDSNLERTMREHVEDSGATWPEITVVY